MRQAKLLWITAALVTASACKKAEAPEAESPAPVQVTSVTQATIRKIVAGDGVLFPEEQASVMPKISAPVQKFYVSRGDHVKQGQLLATLENRDLVAAAGEAKGAVDQAESNLRATQGSTVPEAVEKAQTDLASARETRDAAKKVLDGRQQLAKEGALAHRLVDDAAVSYAQANSQYQVADQHLKTLQSVAKEEQIKAAEAQVASAKSHYESLTAQADYAKILSPIAGIIADRPVNVGEMASSGASLLTIMNIARVVARVNVPQTEAGTVKIGQKAVLAQPGSKDEIEGKVSVVSPATDANTTTIQVWIQIPNPGETLKPGTSVHALIVTEEYKAATVVPVAAVLPGEEGGTAVLTVSSDSVAHKRGVKLGVREGNQVQILSGLTPGEEVVTVGGMGVDDKAKVKIVVTQVEESDDDEDTNEPPPPPAGKDGAKPSGK